MKQWKSLILAILLAFTVTYAQAEDDTEIASSDYLRLLKATKFIENYKEMAAASSKVFAARSQGSDNDYAQYLSVVASADLSDACDCMVAVYKTQNLTGHDITTLISFFESPLGVKLLQQTQKMMIDDIKRGSHQPIAPDVFTEEEKQGIMKIQQDASYKKYGLMTVNREFATGMMKCIAGSSAVKKFGPES